ncbi:TPM domain-containing protein [Immundisolibacter sp.]
MNLKRIVGHLLTTHRQLERTFPKAALAAIEQTIKASEKQHAGQVRFVVEAALDNRPLFRGQTARERALELFSQLRLWDTQHNNGVLIYLLLADRDVEIVADRGIHARVGTEQWEAVCRAMETAFRQNDYKAGAIHGIEAVSRHLSRHFPADGGAGQNELPDAPMLL